MMHITNHEKFFVKYKLSLLTVCERKPLSTDEHL